MPRQTKEPFSTLADFKVKINHHERAVLTEIRRYKNNYLSKAVDPHQIESFIRFTKELNLLITSHCKNSIVVAPESLVIIFQEIELLAEDILSKYHALSKEYCQKISEYSRSEPKNTLLSELCSNCSQNLKKSEIERLRNQLLHNADYRNEKSNDVESQKQQEDLHFFAEVNHLLTAKQGQLICNQIQINKYQDVVMKSLDVLIAVQKELQEREKDVVPDASWMNSAKQEMRLLLTENFHDKMPPWIQKMLHYFLRIHYQKIARLQREASVQTDISTQSQMLQLKKSIYISKTKIDQYQSQNKLQQKELNLISTEKKALQEQVDYYKRQMNTLLEEISDLKTENQIIMMKLNNSRFRKTREHNREHSELEQQEKQSMRDTVRSNRSLVKKINKTSSDNKLLPRIQEQSVDARFVKDTRTSIKIQPQMPSLHRSEQKKRTLKVVHKSSGASDSSYHDKSGMERSKLQRNDKEKDHVQERVTPEGAKNIKEEGKGYLTEAKDEKDCRETMQFDMTGENVIQQEDGETNLEQERLRAKKIDDRLKQTIKHGKIQKYGNKHYFSSSLPEVGLKKIPRKTIKPSYLQSPLAQQDVDSALIRTQSQQIQSALQSSLQSAYNQLTNSGYLIKISEEEFKSMIKIKSFKFNGPEQEPLLRATLNEDLLKTQYRNQRHERLAVTRREWNTSRFNHERHLTVRPTVQLSQQLTEDFFIIFTNQRNAYNYETSLTKNHSKGVYKMSKCQQQYVSDLFLHLSQLKIYDNQKYKFICSYLRYPFQMLQNNFEMTFLNEMKSTSFVYYLQKIMAIHVRCKKKDGVCAHMVQFKLKVETAVEQGKRIAASEEASMISVY